MLKRIDGYWIEYTTHSVNTVELKLPPFPPGTNVYANISLSTLQTMVPDIPERVPGAWAFIYTWTTYLPNGSQSPPHFPTGGGHLRNALGVENCATITFVLGVSAAHAAAQINVFTF